MIAFQSLRQFDLCMSDFPKVLTIVEKEVFICPTGTWGICFQRSFQNWFQPQPGWCHVSSIEGMVCSDVFCLGWLEGEQD